MHTKDTRALLAWIEDQIEFHTNAEGADDALTKNWKKLHKKVSKSDPDVLSEDFHTVYTLMESVLRFEDDSAALRLIAKLGLGVEWSSPFVIINFVQGDGMEPVEVQMDEYPDEPEKEELRALRDAVHQAADQWMFNFSGIHPI